MTTNNAINNTLPNGSVTNAMLAGSIAASKLATVPAICISQSTTTSIGGSTTILGYDTVVIDNTSTYNASTKLWTPNVAGTYFIMAQCNCVEASTANNAIYIYKNGTGGTLIVEVSVNITATVSENVLTISGLVALNGSTDYVGIYASQDVGTNKNYGSQGLFVGHLIAGA
jgi:hypothetical protein